MRPLLFAGLVAVVAVAGAACGEEAPPACIAVDTSCAPLYPPTFENVYANTLRVTCGSERSACHSRTGEGNMSLAEPSIAHQALLAGRVAPGDPACSELIVRTSSPGADYQMPPGQPLSEAERCALIQWVAAGAPGPAGQATP